MQAFRGGDVAAEEFVAAGGTVAFFELGDELLGEEVGFLFSGGVGGVGVGVLEADDHEGAGDGTAGFARATDAAAEGAGDAEGDFTGDTAGDATGNQDGLAQLKPWENRAAA